MDSGDADCVVNADAAEHFADAYAALHGAVVAVTCVYDAHAFFSHPASSEF